MADVPEDNPRLKVGEAAREALGATQRAVGVEPGLPFRTIVLLGVAGVSLAFAAQPFDALGIAAVVLLALDTGRHRHA